MNSSGSLRPKVRWALRKVVFASCWVMVLPPSRTWPERRLITAARTSPTGSTPQWW